VANPTKPKAISDILLRNQEKLIDFLSSFHTDRKCRSRSLSLQRTMFNLDRLFLSGTDDEQFNDEKAYLIKQISELKETKA
jgi:calcium binding protein 39